VHVSGIAHGTLRLHRSGSVTGTLGGHHVSYKASTRAAAATLRTGGSLWGRRYVPRRLPSFR
jgi:xanthine/CO dehydrogenase XdhC/CoxF family maturation factor